MSSNIKGFKNFTLLDYPRKMACIVYLGGCNFNCPYCHNYDLAHNPENYTNINIDNLRELIKKAKEKSYINGVVITGGEPCLDKISLLRLIYMIKEIGLDIKLDTNGSFPDVLNFLINNNLINYIAMDIKTNIFDYPNHFGIDYNLIFESINIIINSGLEYEFRTTAYPRLVNITTIMNIVSNISNANLYYIQQYKKRHESDIEPYTVEQLKYFVHCAKYYIPNTFTR